MCQRRAISWDRVDCPRRLFYPHYRECLVIVIKVCESVASVIIHLAIRAFLIYIKLHTRVQIK